MKSVWMSVAVSVVLLAGAAQAAMHEDFKRFGKKWSCTATPVVSGDQKPYTFKATLEFTSLQNGKALMESYKEKANKDHTSPYATNGIWAVDKDKFIGFNVANDGSTNTRTSTGWNGDTWTWDVGDGLRFVFVSKGKKMDIAVNVKGKDAQWSNVNNLACK